MIKSPIAQLLTATVFQFYVSIVDPSILAQPLVPAAPGTQPATVNTAAVPANPAAPAPTQNGSGQSDGQRRRALQQGATQPQQ